MCPTLKLFLTFIPLFHSTSFHTKYRRYAPQPYMSLKISVYGINIAKSHDHRTKPQISRDCLSDGFCLAIVIPHKIYILSSVDPQEATL